ncbi:hypothetical protein PUN32_13490 [Vibrio sp. dsl-7]|uniref:Uncharacterized protein n=1 Tax=Vibrio chanodichtyis TaxID=3027932 RepID=A0ABT5V5B5_9VIBR|nr:hypothetical protein [Vibrio chanodichtyis]MDE1516013.1 hypothetical protein [Vibrio chanodichtyis]
MSKQLLMGQEILVAPRMRGGYNNGVPFVQDEENDVQLDPTLFSDKVSIYEREVTGWFLNPAKSLVENDSFNNAFLVIMVCMSYIEGVEQYKTGQSSNRNSSAFFFSSMNKIYPNQYSNDELSNLYNKTRCGLFHNGMIKSGVIFSNEFDRSLLFDDNGGKIFINQEKLLNDLIQDFSSYIELLKSDVNSEDVQRLKSNFDTMFTILPTED